MAFMLRAPDRCTRSSKSLDLTDEMKQTTHFMFGKLCENGAPDAGTMKKLRTAMLNFKSEVEEILQGDHLTEKSKLQAALDIFTALKMPRERDAVADELTPRS